MPKPQPEQSSVGPFRVLIKEILDIRLRPGPVRLFLVSHVELRTYSRIAFA